jgi:uncharacterized protein
MVKRLLLIPIILLVSFETLAAQGTDRYQVLLFTKSETYPWRHSSISNGVEMFKELSANHNFGLTWTDDSEIFNDHERLNSMDVVVFMNTSGDILDEDQKSAFQEYIRNGGNFVGIHGASFTMMEWPWYISLLGAVWDRHPGIHTAVVNVEDHHHPATAHLPSSWIITEEWYNFQNISDNIRVLLHVDEETYQGGEMPDYHPVAWYQEDFEGARTFYTLLGHKEEAYDDPWFRRHIFGAVWWAATGHKPLEE